MGKIKHLNLTPSPLTESSTVPSHYILDKQFNLFIKLTISLYCLINLIANFSLLSFITYSYFNLFFASQCQAKLPRGIQNIRPHLESVDNVPLLVPLFTDCTPSGKGRHFLTVVKELTSTLLEETLKLWTKFCVLFCCCGSSNQLLLSICWNLILLFIDSC